jgi:hypothetical protein
VEVKVGDSSRRVGETANKKKHPERAFRIPAPSGGQLLVGLSHISGVVYT